MGYFSANWVVTGMSRGMRTQQKMLQKKLANISADSEDVQAHTEPELVEPQLVTPPVKKPAKKKSQAERSNNEDRHTKRAEHQDDN